MSVGRGILAGAKQAKTWYVKWKNKIYATKNPKVVDDILKYNPKANITTRAPKNLKQKIDNIKPPPKSLSQPQGATTGRFQKKSPPPALGKQTSPKKPDIDVKPPSKKNVTTVALKKPRSVTTTSPKKPDMKFAGSGSSDSFKRFARPLNKKALTGRPATLRTTVLEGGPQIDTESYTAFDMKKIQKRKRQAEDKLRKIDKKFPVKKKSDIKILHTPSKTPNTGPLTDESFAKAFKRNRAAGMATFTWKGKLYTTRYKNESVAKHKKKFKVGGNYKDYRRKKAK
mgnify:FL=1